MDLFWNVGLPVLFAMIAAAWTYGSSEEVKRARFKGWALGMLSAVAPGVNAVFSVTAFLTSDQPMQRQEVFFLIVQLFNGLAYGSAFFACLLLTVRKEGLGTRKHQENLMLMAEGERLILFIADGADLQTVACQLAESGITVTLAKLESGKASVVVETPPLVLRRVERLS